MRFYSILAFVGILFTIGYARSCEHGSNAYMDNLTRVHQNAVAAQKAEQARERATTRPVTTQPAGRSE